MCRFVRFIKKHLVVICILLIVALMVATYVNSKTGFINNIVDDKVNEVISNMFE